MLDKPLRSVWLTLFLLCFSCCLFSAHSAHAETLRIFKRPAAAPPSPPYIWEDNCNQATTGAIAHMLEKMLASHHYQLHWQPGPDTHQLSYQQLTERHFQALAAGQVDLVFTGQPVNNDRFITSRRAIANTGVVAYLRPTLNVQHVAQLQQWRGAMALEADSPVYHRMKQRFPNTQSTDDFSKLLHLLEQQSIDFIITGRFQGALLERTYASHTGQTLPSLEISRHNTYISALNTQAMRQLLAAIDEQQVKYQQQDYLHTVNQLYFKQWINRDKRCTAALSATP